MNFLSFFKKKKIQDELCGEWSTCDHSGFYGIMGSWMEINKNGSGKYESWSNSGDEDNYNYSGEFTWERIDYNKISINESKTEIIEYEINYENGRIELTSSNPNFEKYGIKSFWLFAQIMFKKL